MRRCAMALETTPAISTLSPPGVENWRPSWTGSSPSAATTFWRTEDSDPSGMCSPIRSMAAMSALASREQARGPRERVAIGLGVDLDRAIGMDLGIEHVGARAEVDDVEDLDVLAQLLLGDLD